jgi:hypothetical protein
LYVGGYVSALHVGRTFSEAFECGASKRFGGEGEGNMTKLKTPRQLIEDVEQMLISWSYNEQISRQDAMIALKHMGALRRRFGLK